MGNDGGSIPRRNELVKEAAKLKTASEIKETQLEQQEYHWTTCPLSHRPLKPPIVSDSGGYLYNKDAILEYLLASEDPAEAILKADKDKIVAGRVKSLKDVVEVKFQVEDDKWVCPITNKPLGPAVKSAYLVPCGHVFSEVALKEVDDTKCLQCAESYVSDNIVTILPTSTSDKEKLIQRIQSLKEQGLSHSLKKAASSKKKRKHVVEEKLSTAMNINGAPAKTTIKNPATASLTARILAEEEEKAKRRKLERNNNISSLFAAKNRGPVKDSDFMTRGYSTAADSRR